MYLRDVAEVFAGLTLGGRTIAGRGAVRLNTISLKDIVRGRIEPERTDPVYVDHIRDATRYMAAGADVVVAVRGTLPKVAIVPDALNGAVVTSTLAGIRPRDVLPEVLVAFLRSPAGRTSLQSRVRSATGQISLTLEDVRNIDVPVPPMDVQQHIADIMRTLDEHDAASREALLVRHMVADRVITDLFQAG